MNAIKLVRINVTQEEAHSSGTRRRRMSELANMDNRHYQHSGCVSVHLKRDGTNCLMIGIQDFG
jgi:hypothetical protein